MAYHNRGIIMYQNTNLKLTTKKITAKIFSVGTYLPEQVVNSDHLFDEINSEAYGFPVDWMSKNMGIIERRMSEEGSQPSDLAIPAARRALECLDGFNPDEIGMIIFCGIERDQSEPATAHTVQHALGLKAYHAFDIANACIGFIDGVEIASKFVTTGAIKYALVVTGEVPTRLSRTFVGRVQDGISKADFEKGIGALSVGDAGGAMIIGPSDTNEKTGFQMFSTAVDSSHIDKCIYWRNDAGELEGHMNMGRILGRGLKIHRSMIDRTLEELGWSDFDWVLSHQTGKRCFEGVRKLTNTSSEKMIKIYHNHGNTTTATFPLLWEKLSNNGIVSSGDRVGGIFAGSGLATCQFGLYY